jgi:outer membrane protein OmpU
MNKLRKIGVSALAGALVSFSATAAEWNISGQAGITMSNTNEASGTSSFSQDDAITVSASGQTESGLNISAKFNLEDKGNGFDEKNVAIGMDSLGTLTFHGHGGSPVMGQFDDVTPKAYEEVWDVTGDGDVTGTDYDASSSRINGIGETNNLFTYDSPVISGVQFKAAYATSSADSALSITNGNDTTGSSSKYWDWGISIAPEMVDGLTLYYANGERDLNALVAGQEADETTMAITYAYGPVTVGYQESEEDRSGVATDNEIEAYSIAYAITDDLTVSYGQREFDHDTSASTGDGNLTQKDTGYGVSYTMGGVSIGASFNSSDNVGGGNATTDDVDGYEMNVSFAF